jgi:hypothetical protein
MVKSDWGCEWRGSGDEEVLVFGDEVFPTEVKLQSSLIISLGALDVNRHSISYATSRVLFGMRIG